MVRGGAAAPTAGARARGRCGRAAEEVAQLGQAPKPSGVALLDLAGTLSLCTAAVARDAARPLAVRERRAEGLAGRRSPWWAGG